MDSRRLRIGPRPQAVGLVLTLGLIVGPIRIDAQEPPTAAASEPSDPASSPTLSPHEVELEARVRQLEALVKQLSTQVQQLNANPAAPASGTSSGPGAVNEPTNPPSAIGGAAAPGQSLPPNPAPSNRFDSPATLDNARSNVRFGPGFEIRSLDDEYIWQFHNLTQFDYRGHEQAGQDPVRDTFVIPRQWFMFGGRITQPFGYFVAIANGFDNLSILDAFLDVDFDPRVRLRIGRYKTPFTYEFLVEPVQGLMLPERSFFFNNFGLIRDEGIMAFGRILDKQVDYAAGIFNGTRNALIDLNSNKSVAGFVNWHPFWRLEGSLLENFNVGGSTYGGRQGQVPIPQIFRTVVPTNGNAILGVPFLALNNDVRESGMLAYWDLHTAWFYKQLAVVGEWGSGFTTYAFANSMGQRTQVPVNSFYVQAGYLLTGETRSSVGIVKPRHPVSFKRDSGLGAWEVSARYQLLDIGNNVFTAGFADPNQWTDRIQAVDVGLNWHLTQYAKMYFMWEHTMFGAPVDFAPGRQQLTSDLFLLRFQLFF